MEVDRLKSAGSFDSEVRESTGRKVPCPPPKSTRSIYSLLKGLTGADLSNRTLRLVCSSTQVVCGTDVVLQSEFLR